MISYYKYYLELKNRFFLLVFTWFSVLAICYLYKEIILFILINSSNYFNSLTTKPYFIFTNVSEVFYVYLELIFFISNQTVLLMFFYHTLMFLSLGLYKFEFIKLRFAFQFFLLAWGISVFLLYKFVIPYSWAFFLSFQQNENTTQSISFFFEAKIVEYFNYFTSSYYICLINCQFLALLTLLLTNISEKLNKIKTFRKLFYFVFVIFSTLTTPPDIISQMILSITLISIYEILIFLKYLKINKVTN
jgi:sec-independent protein translocase protein TatC